MLIVSENQPQYYCWDVEQGNGTSVNRFSIEKAIESDVDTIVSIAKEAYFHPRSCELTHRNPDARNSYDVTDRLIRRRFDKAHAHKYHVLVCKVQQVSKKHLNDIGDKVSEGKIIGTVYYQKTATDFEDDQQQPLGELGLLAIHPDWWGKTNGISSHLIDAVVDLAKTDKMRAIYIYAIGTLLSDGRYSNSLLNNYNDKGFEFTSKWKPGKANKDLYTTDDGFVDMVLMVKKLEEGKDLRTIMAKNRGEIGEIKI